MYRHQADGTPFSAMPTKDSMTLPVRDSIYRNNSRPQRPPVIPSMGSRLSSHSFHFASDDSTEFDLSAVRPPLTSRQAELIIKQQHDEIAALRRKLSRFENQQLGDMVYSPTHPSEYAPSSMGSRAWSDCGSTSFGDEVESVTTQSTGIYSAYVTDMPENFDNQSLVDTESAVMADNLSNPDDVQPDFATGGELFPYTDNGFMQQLEGAALFPNDSVSPSTSFGGVSFMEPPPLVPVFPEQQVPEHLTANYMYRQSPANNEPQFQTPAGLRKSLLSPMGRFLSTSPQEEGSSIEKVIEAANSAPYINAHHRKNISPSVSSYDAMTAMSSRSGSSVGTTMSVSAMSVSSGLFKGATERKRKRSRMIEKPVARSLVRTDEAEEKSAEEATPVPHDVDRAEEAGESGVKTLMRPPKRKRLGNIYQCTFCVDFVKSSFQKVADWKRHENSVHLGTRIYCCSPFGASLSEPGNGLLTCGFCSKQMASQGMARHLEDAHSWSKCSEKRLEDRNYTRKDKLVQHLKRVHYTDYQSHMDGWVLTETPPLSRCGFCGDQFTSWDERCEHVATHFNADSTPSAVTMEDWVGDWGFTPAWNERVARGVPPMERDLFHDVTDPAILESFEHVSSDANQATKSQSPIPSIQLTSQLKGHLHRQQWQDKYAWCQFCRPGRWYGRRSFGYHRLVRHGLHPDCRRSDAQAQLWTNIAPLKLKCKKDLVDSNTSADFLYAQCSCCRDWLSLGLWEPKVGFNTRNGLIAPVLNYIRHVWEEHTPETTREFEELVETSFLASVQASTEAAAGAMGKGLRNDLVDGFQLG